MEPENEFRAALREERVPAGDLLLPSLGALAAAVVGGIAWGLIVQATDAEWGFAAVGVGFLAGTAVVFLSKGKRGVPLQVVAALAAVVGVLWGKYFAFVQVGKGVIREEFGVTDALPLFSGETFSLFVSALGDLFGGFDLLWVAFAVYSAWRIPQRSGQPAPAPATPAP